MRALIFFLLPLVAADLYKETQNFQYSRTGDQEGEKKGFFESQTGNMGGNFEVSHNMDTMAQRQMKGLAMTVGSQLGIDPNGIGTGAAVDQLGPGSVFGSASTRGTAYGLKGLEAERLNMGTSGRYGSESRQAGGSYGTQQRELSSTYGSRISGQRLTGSDYNQAQGRYYGESDSAIGASSVSGVRQTAGQQMGTAATGSRYSSGSSRYHASSYHDHGETDAAGDTYQRGTSYVPVAGVSQVGIDSATAGSQYRDTNYQQSMGAEESRRFTAGESQIRTGGSVVRPIVVRPGSTVRLSVLPNQVVPIQIPVTAQTGQQGYTQQNTRYSSTGALRSENTDAEYVDDNQQRRNYGVETDSHTQNIGTDRLRGGVTKGHQSSYSYNKEWEKHSSTGDRTYTPSLIVTPVTDMGNAAQNRDKLLVAGAEIGAEAQGSTVYNSGSRVASTGRQYGSSQTYRENTGQTQQNYATDSSRRTAASGNYNAGRIGQRLTDSEGLGSQVYSVTTKPKSYESSYSYQKSWEKHGTPYTIDPASQGMPEARSLTSQSRYGENGEIQNQDISQMEAHGSRYGESSRIASSSRTAGNQFESSQGSSLASSGGSRADTLSLDMATLQQRLRDQMGKMCVDCGTGNGNTKGYSAHYSYSAQRSYGGAADQATDGQTSDYPRFKRSPYYHRSEDSEEQEDLGQQTQDFGSNFDFELKNSDTINEKLAALSHKLKDAIETLEKQTKDLGQETQDFSEIYSHKFPKLEVGNVEYNRNLEQEPEDLGQQTQKFSGLSHTYQETSQQQWASATHYNRHYQHETEHLGQETENIDKSGNGFLGTTQLHSPKSPTFQWENTEANEKPYIREKPQISDYSQIYERPIHNPKLQVGSMTYSDEHIGQESYDLGQQTEDLGQKWVDSDNSTPKPLQKESSNFQSTSSLRLGSNNFNKQNAGTLNLEVEDVMDGKQIEDLGQQTEDLGQQTEDFGQQVEDLGQKFETFGSNMQTSQISNLYTHGKQKSTINHNDNSKDNTERLTINLENKIKQKTQSNIEYDDNKNVDLQVGSILQQNEFFGQQPVNFEQSSDVIAASQTISENHDSPIEKETASMGENTKMTMSSVDSAYENNRNIEHSYHHSNPEQTNEEIDSHLAEILAALQTTNYKQNTVSKLDNIQAKYTEEKQTSYSLPKKISNEDKQFNRVPISSPGLEIEYSNWDQQVQSNNKELEHNVYHVVQTQQKPIASYSFLDTNQKDQENEEKSFLDMYPEHLNKNTERGEEPKYYGTSTAKDINTEKFDDDVTSQHLPGRGDIEQLEGQQTLVEHWDSELFQPTPVRNNNHQENNKFNQRSPNLIQTSLSNKNREDTNNLHQEHQQDNFNNMGQETLKENFEDLGQETLKENFEGLGQETLQENYENLGQETVKENFEDLGQETMKENYNNLQKYDENEKNKQKEMVTTSTSKPSFWNKMSTGLGKAKDKAKSWFG